MTNQEMSEAKDEIRELLARYCRAIDRCDAALLAEIYHPDAIDDHGLPGVDPSAAAFRAAVLPLLEESWVSTHHLIGSSAIEVLGKKAFAETYVIAHHVRNPDPSGKVLLDIVGARYIDRFEERGDGWRIAHRVVATDWRDSQELDDALDLGGHTGRRGPEDPVYAARAGI